MSGKVHRRRAKSSGAVKQAFEEEDPANHEDEKHHGTRTKSKKHSSSSDKHSQKKKVPEKVYERALFTLDNITVEVILNNDVVSWSTIRNTAMVDEIYEKKPTEKKPTESVNLKDVYAIMPICETQKWPLSYGGNLGDTTNSSSTAPKLRGFQLHSYRQLADSALDELLVIFQSNSATQIQDWFDLLSKRLAYYRPPRDVLVLCNPYAGARDSRHIYNTQIKPIFERARYNIHHAEIDDQLLIEHAIEQHKHKFENLHGLVVIGGDGSVIQVINALIRHAVKAHESQLDTKSDLPPLPFPLCIVPNGTTNAICHSIYGTTDQNTPILHLLFDHRMKIDMCAVFDAEYQFVTANFSSGAGFAANALRYFPRYSLLNSKKAIQKSFAKAASKKNLKPLEVTIRYVPAKQDKTYVTRCYRGCPTCFPAALEENNDEVQPFDTAHVEQIDRQTKPRQRDNERKSRPSSALKHVDPSDDEEITWQTLQTQSSQVLVLTNAHLWSFAPQGLSKFGHLADGVLHLVTVAPTSRKEFLRYVKRNGDSRDQYEFSFVKLIKVKEVEIELTSFYDDVMDESDEELDLSPSEHSSFEESDGEGTKPSTLSRQPQPPPTPLSESTHRFRRRQNGLREQTPDISRKQSDNETLDGALDTYGSSRRKNMLPPSVPKSDKASRPPSSGILASEFNKGQSNDKRRPSISASLRPRKSLSNLLIGSTTTLDRSDKVSLRLRRDSTSSATNSIKGRRASVGSQSSSWNAANKSSSKKRKQPCMWNLDFTPYNSPLIRIKCFHRFLTVFGQGLHSESTDKECHYSCF